MAHRSILAILLLSLLAAPVGAGDDKKNDAAADKPAVKIATAKEVKHELKIFKRDFDTADIDFKLDAVIRLSKCVHQDVTDRLLKILLREKDPYVQAGAAEGLANQVPFADRFVRRFRALLEEKDTDPMILTGLIKTLGKLDYRKYWEQIAELLEHYDDDVVVAAFDVLGKWRELRAYRDIQTFWDTYPEEGKWVTGSVTVDTGAAGTTDQEAAEAAWRAKYGNKNRYRARPDCVKACRRAVESMTREEIQTPAEFRRWCKAHKGEIKAAGRKKKD